MEFDFKMMALLSCSLSQCRIVFKLYRSRWSSTIDFVILFARSYFGIMCLSWSFDRYEFRYNHKEWINVEKPNLDNSVELNEILEITEAEIGIFKSIRNEMRAAIDSLLKVTFVVSCGIAIITCLWFINNILCMCVCWGGGVHVLVLCCLFDHRWSSI